MAGELTKHPYREHAIIVKNKITGAGALTCALTKHFIGWNDGTMTNVIVKDGACIGTPTNGCGNGKIVAIRNFIYSTVNCPGPPGELESVPPPGGSCGWGNKYYAYPDSENPTVWTQTSLDGYMPENGPGYKFRDDLQQWWYGIYSWPSDWYTTTNNGDLFGWYDTTPSGGSGRGWVTAGDPSDPANQHIWTYTYDFPPGVVIDPTTVTNLQGITSADLEWLSGNTQVKITKIFTAPGQECPYIRLDCKELIP